MNILNLCDNSTPGELIIPINNISITPDGFWKFEAISPNYFTEMEIYNATGDLVINNEFLSGESINITAKINKSSVIAAYITETKAQLQIRFPNGTIWSDMSQFTSVDSNGNIKFNLFFISISPFM